MVKVFDVRKSDGQILLLGGSLTLPNTGTVVTGSVPAGSIRYNPSSQNIEVNGGSSWSPVSQITISNNTVVSNISGITASPIGNTLTAIIDACIGNIQGNILYRNSTIWTILAPGTNGQILTTQGASANPIWTTFGLSSLPTQANDTILSNISGITAAPSANTLTAIIDSCIGSTQGDILYRGASTWAVLAPSTSGWFLQTQGASANPIWASAALSSQADSTILSNISGTTATPSANTLTAIIDHAIDNTQGDILYRNATIWTSLSHGTTGAFLMTQGASANPIWQTIGYSNLPSEIQNQLATVSIPGQPTASAYCLIIPIVQNTQIPANFAGSAGYSGTNATSSSSFVASYIHSGSPTSIGNITFASSGSTPTFPSFSAVNLVSGDILLVTTPVSQDSTLANVGLTLVLLKQ